MLDETTIKEYMRNQEKSEIKQLKPEIEEQQPQRGLPYVDVPFEGAT